MSDSKAESHRDIMVRLAWAYGWRRGVELGVGHGHLFRRLLHHAPALHLIGVDVFRREDRRASAFAAARRFPDRALLLACSTVEAADIVPDGSVDFVFVDAGHSYQAASTDIQLWHAKVRPGGWFGGHDYHPAFPGVQRAVRKAFGDAVELLPFAIWHALDRGSCTTGAENRHSPACQQRP